MEIAILSQEVAHHSRALCRELLPDGIVKGNNYRIGNVYGEKGDSLSVQLEGENAGNWKDFESGDGGDLIDLVSKNLGLPIKDSMEWLKRRYGIKDNVKKVVSSVKKAKPFSVIGTAVSRVPPIKSTGTLTKARSSAL